MIKTYKKFFWNWTSQDPKTWSCILFQKPSGYKKQTFWKVHNQSLHLTSFDIDWWCRYHNFLLKWWRTRKEKTFVGKYVWTNNTSLQHLPTKRSQLIVQLLMSATQFSFQMVKSSKKDDFVGKYALTKCTFLQHLSAILKKTHNQFFQTRNLEWRICKKKRTQSICQQQEVTINLWLEKCKM